MSEASVFLCCPTKRTMDRETAVSCMTASRKVRLEFSTRGTSLLALNFNLAWCEALNRRDAWADSWGIYSSADDGGAGAMLWELRRRKKKQEQRNEPNRLPPLAALLEALED